MSYKVIIADDEPLVLIGLQDLINWQSEGFELVAQARNGQMLSQAIEEHNPDLVITDIKMPVKSGLDVMQEEKEKGKKLPLFIFLTSFEEFDLIKKAMSLEAVDYIVKLELDKAQLIQALDRAKKKISQLKVREENGNIANEHKYLQERYLMRLLFASDIQDLKASDAGLDLDASCFVVAYVTLPGIIESQNVRRNTNLYYSACHLIEETANRYSPCYITQLDLGHIAAIFPFTDKTKAGYRSYIYSAFKASCDGLKNFFSLDSIIYVGSPVYDISLICESFSNARLIAAGGKKTGDEKIVFYDHVKDHDTAREILSLDTPSFTRAFSELNGELLEQNISTLISQMKEQALPRVNAIDLASSILYMACYLVPDAYSCLEDIFPSSENIYSYRQLFQSRNTEDVTVWLDTFAKGFARLFKEKKQDYRMQTIQKIQAYINENLSRKLTLGTVASVFGYSQSYLSSIFSKYASMSFVDYVNNAKIEKAKQMLADPKTMVYEVATSLGFESQFYFSKVFKKVAGVSPTSWQNNINGKGESDAQGNHGERKTEGT